MPRSVLLTTSVVVLLAACLAVLWVSGVMGPSAELLPSPVTLENDPLRPPAENPPERRRATDAGQPAGSPQAVLRPEETWLSDMTPKTGVDFVHHSGDSDDKPFPSANGSGLAALDYDHDGQIDLLFATGNDFPLDATTATHTNRCYRNLGNWAFRDVTEHTGLAHRGYTHGVTVADIDADGFCDVLITCYGPDVVFMNMGDGSFQETTTGAEDARWSSSAAFFDADSDGLLDLYVCHYGSWSLEDNPFCGDAAAGLRVFCSPLTVEPTADTFFHNDGNGRLRDASDSAGILVEPGRGLGVLAAHLDDDLHLDLYVANDLNHNVLLAGNEAGTFTDRSDLSGAAYDSLGRVKSSMGIDAADTRGTGRFDLLVTDFQREYNLLFTNAGGGMFVDASEGSGVGPSSVQLVSWGVQFADIDLDGSEDALVTSGHVGDERDPTADLRQPALLLQNLAGRFATIPAGQAGDYFLSPHQGRGLIAADLDNDGDEDFIFNPRDEPASLLANVIADRASPQRAGLCVRLVGTQSNRDAIGSVARLTTSPPQMRQVKGGGGYQSTRDPRLFFAVAGEEPVTLLVRWPTGQESTIEGLAAGGHYVVIEPTNTSPPRTLLLQGPK